MLVESQATLGDAVFYNDCVVCRGRRLGGVIIGTEGLRVTGSESQLSSVQNLFTGLTAVQ